MDHYEKNMEFIRSAGIKREPEYLETGPEPTIGRRTNRQVRADVLIYIEAALLSAFDFLLICLVKEAGEKGIDFQDAYITAEKWYGSSEFVCVMAIIFILTAVIIGLIVDIIMRKIHKDQAVTGKVVGYRRSRRSASSTESMDLVVDGMVGGKHEYVRVRTFNYGNNKSICPLGSKVEFYKHGRYFYAKL